MIRYDVMASRSNQREPAVAEAGQNTLRWKAIFAGTAVAILAYATLMSLGFAIGGSNLQSVVQGQSSAEGLGIGAGVWMVLAVLLSLCIGGYVATRVSAVVAQKMGRLQGAVVAGLFFAFTLSQAGLMIGSLGRGVGSTLSALSGAVADISQNTETRDILDNAFSDLTFRSSIETVMDGLASRLIRGDEEGALTFLSRQSGITRAEAQKRIDAVRAEFNQAVVKAGTVAAKTMTYAGWALFGSLALGTFFGMLGGGIGAQMNRRQPFTAVDRRDRAKEESWAA